MQVWAIAHWISTKCVCISQILSSLLYVGAVWFMFTGGCSAAITKRGQPVLRGHGLSHWRVLHSIRVRRGCHCWPVFLPEENLGKKISWSGRIILRLLPHYFHAPKQYKQPGDFLCGICEQRDIDQHSEWGQTERTAAGNSDVRQCHAHRHSERDYCGCQVSWAQRDPARRPWIGWQQAPSRLPVRNFFLFFI